jgi:hypothetical protein
MAKDYPVSAVAKHKMARTELAAQAADGHRAAVDQIRRDVAAVQAALAEIEAAPPTRDEIAARIGAALDAICADRRDYAIPTGLMGAALDTNGIENMLKHPYWLLLLLRGQLEKWLLEQADAHLAANPPGLAAAARQAKRAELSAALLNLERQEETIISKAEVDGMPIARRPDADPRVVFSIGAG